jgi:hypothetical protein
MASYLPGAFLTIPSRFLLAKFHLEYLQDQTSEKMVRDSLSRLPHGADALNESYTEAMSRIEMQLPNFVHMAKKLLSWVISARRPLTVPELQHALAIELFEPVFDVTNLSSLKELVSKCAGLVTISQSSGTVQLVHYTAQEYFDRTGLQIFPDAAKDIALACLTYISYDTFAAGSSDSDETFQQRLKHYAFFEYAARFWGDHAVKPMDEQAKRMGLRLLQDGRKIASCVQAMQTLNRTYKGYSQA